MLCEGYAYYLKVADMYVAMIVRMHTAHIYNGNKIKRRADLQVNL